MHFFTLYSFRSVFVFFIKESLTLLSHSLYPLNGNQYFFALSYSLWFVSFNALRAMLISVVGVAYTSV